MRAVPGAVRGKLPDEWLGFKTAVRPWLAQLYYGDEPRIHYEVWLLAPRFHQGPNSRLVEVGLHFESREPGENQRLLELCYKHLFEIKSELGTQVEAEPWTRGWTKIYETFPLDGFTEDFLDRTAARAARYIEVLQPLVARPPAVKKQPARRRR